MSLATSLRIGKDLVTAEVINPVSAFGPSLTSGVESVRRAVLTRMRFDYGTKTYTGAVYRSSGALAFSSVRPAYPVASRPVDPLTIKVADYNAAKHVPEALYAGHFFYHWGHFLIEALPPAIYANDFPHSPVVYLPYTEHDAKFYAHVEPLLRAAWGDREIFVATEDMRFDVLHVAQRLVAYGVQEPMMHAASAQIFEKMRASFADDIKEPHRRLFLVRDEKHPRAMPYEAKIGDWLTAHGFEVIRPEVLSSVEQVRLYAQAEVLVSFAGSITHNSVFMSKGTKVFELAAPGERANRMQYELCKICAQSFERVEVDPELRNLERVLSVIECSS